jgi:acyl carrier protein
MFSDEIFERVRKVISKTFKINIERITLEDSLFLGLNFDVKPNVIWGSFLDFSHCPCPENSFDMKALDGLELSMALQDEFDIDIDDTEADGKKSISVKELVEFIAIKIVHDI